MRVQCPNCGALLNAPDNQAGQTWDCPQCSQLMQLPDAPGGMATRLKGATRPAAEPPAGGAARRPGGPAGSRGIRGFGDTAAPTRPATTMSGAGRPPEKPCPYCGEKIMAAALQCHHCQTWLSGPSAGRTEAFPKAPGGGGGAGLSPADLGGLGPAGPTGDGKKALILAIIGIFCFGIILEPLAIYYGIQSLKNPFDKPMGIAGLVIGVIVTILNIVGLLIWLLVFRAVAQGPAPTPF